MPFIPRDELEELQLNTERLRALEVSLEGFHDLPSILHLAGVIKEEVSALLDDQYSDLSTTDIGDLAYKKAFDTCYQEAHDEIVVDYERQHRAELYKRVVEEIREAEGTSIFESVKLRLDTDPALAIELRDSARKELAAKALGVVAEEVTQEQQEIIDIEAERQVRLDRLDVEFAVEGELDLLRDDVIDLVQPGDVLKVYFKSNESNKREKSATFRWTNDAEQEVGWVMVEVNGYIYGSDGYIAKVPKDRFLTVGSLLPVLTKGTTKLVANTLKLGSPLAIAYENDRGTQKALSPANKVNEQDGLGSISRIDFQTRILRFNH